MVENTQKKYLYLLKFIQKCLHEKFVNLKSNQVGLYKFLLTLSARMISISLIFARAVFIFSTDLTSICI